MDYSKSITFYLIILLTTSRVNGISDHVIKLLNTLTESEAEPTNVFIKNCWSVNLNIEMMRMATMQVLFINDFTYQLPIDLSPNHVMFVTDLDCDWTSDFVNGINVNRTFFKHPYRWLMYGSNSTNIEMVEYISYALPDSNIVLAEWKDEDNSFTISQFYKTEPFAETIFESFGRWSASTGLLNLRESKVLAQRRRNLRGKGMRSSGVLLSKDSINHLTDYRDKNMDSVTKVVYLLTNCMLDTMNCSKNFTFYDTWGYYNKETNRINGMLGDLLRNEADIASTPAFMTDDRIGIYEYISMLTPTKAKFIFRAPTLSFITNIYYLPFQANVWFSLVAMVIISCFVIYWTYRVSNMRSPTVDPLRPSDIVLFGVSAICQMGTHREPKYLSGKISTIFFVINLIFVYISYTANIVSLLQSTTKSIRTLDDLYHSGLGFGVEDTPYNRNFFQLSRPGTIHRTIYERKIVPPNEESKYMNLSYGVSLMRKGFFAFHSECGSAYKIIEDTFYEHEKCGLIEIDYLSLAEPWYPIQKHSPYKEIMKVLLFRIREHGIQSREVSRIYAKRPICSSHGQSFESVRLIDCQIVLMILAYGFILSFIVFIIEKIIYARSIESKLCLSI